MTEERTEFESAMEARIEAEFGCPERDAELVAEAASRMRRSEDDVEWAPSFVVERMADAPKSHSVQRKWNRWLDYYGADTRDLGAYEVAEPSTSE